MLYEIIDSDGQPDIQYKVDYAITIVFIIIMIHIPQIKCEKNREQLSTTPNTPYSGPAQHE